MTGSMPVPPLGSDQVLVLLLQLAVLLGTAVLLGQLAVRLGLPSVVGELLAGVVLGPSLLGHAVPGLATWMLPGGQGQAHLLDAIGQFGVLLLVGVAGMHLDVRGARQRRAAIAAVGAGGLVLPLALGLGAGLLLPAALRGPEGGRTVFALFVGVALSVSSIPVIARTLLDLRLLDHRVGQLVISAAVLDDVAGWMLLSVVSAAAASTPSRGQVASSIVVVVLAVVLALTVGPALTRRVLDLAARVGEPGAVVAAVVVIVLACAAGTQALGLEAVFGAFLAGVLVASSGRFDRESLGPLQTLVVAVLAPIFLASAGLRTDLGALARPDVLLAALAVLAVAVIGKFTGAYAGARMARLGHWEALATGAGLNARGVVQIVIGTVGLRLGVLSSEMYTVVVLVAIATSLLAPPLLRWAAGRIPQPVDGRAGGRPRDA